MKKMPKPLFYSLLTAGLLIATCGSYIVGRDNGKKEMKDAITSHFQEKSQTYNNTIFLWRNPEIREDYLALAKFAGLNADSMIFAFRLKGVFLDSLVSELQNLVK